MLSVNEQNQIKVLFFDGGAASLENTNVGTFTVPHVFFHGLIRDDYQQVFYNEEVAPHNAKIVVIGLLTKGIEKTFEYLSKNTFNTQVKVLLIDEPYTDTHKWNKEKFDFTKLCITEEPEQDKSSLSALTTYGAKSDFFEANYVSAQELQFELFQKMMCFFEKRGLRFKELEKKMQWNLTLPYQALKVDALTFSLKQANGFAYEPSKLTIPLEFRYDPSLVYENADKPTTAPTKTSNRFFARHANSLMGLSAVAALFAVYLCSSIEIAIIATLALVLIGLAFKLAQEPKHPIPCQPGV